jgi:hypothetical protein
MAGDSPIDGSDAKGYTYGGVKMYILHLSFISLHNLQDKAA